MSSGDQQRSGKSLWEFTLMLSGLILVYFFVAIKWITRRVG